jgi:hypothetical protein
MAAGAVCAMAIGAVSTRAQANPQSAVVLDAVAAVVNRDVILESDVQEEMRLMEMMPIQQATTEGATREQALERLINRRLILQQEALQPQQPVTDAALAAEIGELRKSLPGCGGGRCESDAGWRAFLSGRGLTPEQVASRWRERISVLNFIEVRFRAGVRIEPQQIADFYKKTMLPEYAKQKTQAPPLGEVSDRIQEVLLEQQVTTLLDAWLKSLREQGSVAVLASGEAAP